MKIQESVAGFFLLLFWFSASFVTNLTNKNILRKKNLPLVLKHNAPFSFLIFSLLVYELVSVRCDCVLFFFIVAIQTRKQKLFVFDR